MIKLNILLIAMLFLPTLSIANNSINTKEIAPFESQLSNLKDKDLIKQVLKIVNETKQNKPDIALYYFDVGIKLLNSLPDDKIKANFHHYVAWAYITRGHYDKATEYANIGLELGKKSTSLSAQSSSLTALGAISLYRGDTVSALNYYKQSLSFARAGNLNINIASSIGNLGSIYYTLDDLDTALQYMKESRDLHVKLKKWTSVAAIEMNIAEIYLKSDNFEQALPYYLSSLKIHEEADNTWYIAKVKSMLGIAYSNQNMLEEAQKYTIESIALYTAIGEKFNITDALQANGIIYQEKKLYEEALGEFNKALNIGYEIKSDLMILTASRLLAGVNLEMGNYDKALTFAMTALEKTKITKSKINERNIHEIISRIYEATENYTQAYKHLLQFKLLNAEIVKQEITDKNERTENLYQSVKKEKTIVQLTADNQLKSFEIESQIYKRNSWISGLALLVFITFFFIYRQNKNKILITERANMMAELVDKKNQLLADVSHELRTPLTVLQLKVEALQHNLVEDVDASYESLMVKISDINRLITDIYQLAQSDIGALKLNLTTNDCISTIKQWAYELSEVVEARGFSWQQQIQLTENSNVNIDCDKIKQVFYNLIENSIAYTDTPGVIRLLARISKTHLEIKIEDSSPGVSNDNLPKLFERLFRIESSRSRATGGSGLGLAICKSIVVAHQGEIISSTSKLGGLAIVIKLPLQAKN